MRTAICSGLDEAESSTYRLHWGWTGSTSSTYQCIRGWTDFLGFDLLIFSGLDEPLDLDLPNQDTMGELKGFGNALGKGWGAFSSGSGVRAECGDGVVWWIRVSFCCT